MHEFRIKVRPVTEADRSIDCLFVEADQDAYELHSNALVEDIGNIKDVASAYLRDNIVIVQTSLEEQTLKDAMETYFRREFCYVRYEGMTRSV